MEVLVDVPTYVAPISGSGASGFTDVAPALKWQISPVPGKFDLSVTAGMGLPTGAAAIAGGLQPYLQFPWSVEIIDRCSMKWVVVVWEGCDCGAFGCFV